MTADPAELIFFREMTPELFFDEAQRLGISTENLQDKQARDQVLHNCLTEIRTRTAREVAAELGISISEDQALLIARHSLVPEVRREPVRLGPEDRRIAEELYFHAIKAAMARHGTSITDGVARSDARKMVRAGERGLTRWQKMFRASGCLVMLGAFALGTAATLASLAVIILAWP